MYEQQRRCDTSERRERERERGREREEEREKERERERERERMHSPLSAGKDSSTRDNHR